MTEEEEFCNKELHDNKNIILRVFKVFCTITCVSLLNMLINKTNMYIIDDNLFDTLLIKM